MFSAEFERLWQQCEENERAFREQHANDPCEKCGATAGVEIIPTGSIARLTPLCIPCRDQMMLGTFKLFKAVGIWDPLWDPEYQRLTGRKSRC